MRFAVADLACKGNVSGLRTGAVKTKLDTSWCTVDKAPCGTEIRLRANLISAGADLKVVVVDMIVDSNCRCDIGH